VAEKTDGKTLSLHSVKEVEFAHEFKGDSIADVLDYVRYRQKEMYKKFHESAEIAVRNKTTTVQERQQMLKLFGESLDGYPYFES